MVKLTPDLIEQSLQYINPVRERELLLRGYKIPVIENLGATLDQYDTIDFSDNDIRKLDGFPLLNRIRGLMLNNNRICRIADDVHTNLPNLKELYLTNNEISELSEIKSLVNCKKLEYLSLMRNPVCHDKHYRSFVVFTLPQVRVLDFRRVKQKERQDAEKLFGSKQGKQLINDIGKKAKTFVPGEPLQNGNTVLDAEAIKDREAIKQAILKASSLEEIEHLRKMLHSGQIPGKQAAVAAQEQTGDEEMET